MDYLSIKNEVIRLNSSYNYISVLSESIGFDCTNINKELDELKDKLKLKYEQSMRDELEKYVYDGILDADLDNFIKSQPISESICIDVTKKVHAFEITQLLKEYLYYRIERLNPGLNFSIKIELPSDRRVYCKAEGDDIVWFNFSVSKHKNSVILTSSMAVRTT